MPLHVWLCGFTMVDVSAGAAVVLVLGVTVVNGHPCIAYSHQTEMPQYPLGCTLIEPTPPITMFLEVFSFSSLLMQTAELLMLFIVDFHLFIPLHHDL